MEKEKYTGSIALTYAQRFGLIAGIVWIASFLCYMYGFKHPVVEMLSLPLGFISIFLVGRNVALLSTNVEDTNKKRMWVVIILSYLFASLLTTLAQYVYFAYLDHGMFLDNVQKTFDMPEMKEILKQYPKDAIKEAFMMFEKPGVVATNMMMYNIFLSFILSLPTLLYASIVSKRK